MEGRIHAKTLMTGVGERKKGRPLVQSTHRYEEQEAVVLTESILLFEEKCASSLSRVFSVGHIYTSKMQTLQ